MGNSNTFASDPKPDMWHVLETVTNMICALGENKVGQGFSTLFQELGNSGLDAKNERLEKLRAENASLYSGILTATALLTNCFNVGEMSYRRTRAAGKYPLQYEGSLQTTLSALAKEKIDPALIAQLRQTEMTLTLTAHPTECNPSKLNKILFQMATLWNQKNQDARKKSPELRTQTDEDILKLMSQAWDIIEQTQEKPTPEEELEWAHWLLQHQAMPLVPQVCRSFDLALKSNGFEIQDLRQSPLKFGLWPSFDRDGNPKVTAEKTWLGALISVHEAFACYSASLERILCCGDQERSWYQGVNALKLRCETLCNKISNMIEAREKGDGADCEPTSLKAEFNTLLDLQKQGQLLSKVELLDMAVECYEAISDDSSAKQLMWDLVKQISTFGISLGTPQVRQESSLHTALLNVITKAQEYNGSYSNWDERTRIGYFTRQETIDPGRCNFDDQTKDVYETFVIIARLNHLFPGLVERYIISLAKDAADVLAVDYCLKAASKAEGLSTCILNIYPLFESQEDVSNSPQTLDTLFSINYYREQLKEYCDNTQGVMNSHSDFRKEQGNLRGYVGLFIQQGLLEEVCNEHGVRIKMFQGRGQSRARGKIDHSIDKILLMPKGSVCFHYDQTWQGEGARHIFMAECGLFVMERHLSGILQASCGIAESPDLDDIQRLGVMSTSAGEEYREWIEREDFMALYDNVTMVNYAKLLPIGSRPARRKTHKSSAKNLRAIAWNKCFHQDRLPIPIFLGMRAALSESEGGCTEAWIKAARDKPLIRAFLQTLERGLVTARTNVFWLAAKSLGTEEDKKTARILIENYFSVVNTFKFLLGQNTLLENNRAWMLGQVQYRNAYIDIAHVASILERKAASSPEEINMTEFFKTVMAVSAGLLCTG